MLRFIAGAPGQITGVVRIVAVLGEFALGLFQQQFGIDKGFGGITISLFLLGLLEQLAGATEVVGLDGLQFSLLIELGNTARFFLDSANIAIFDPAGSILQRLLCLAPRLTCMGWSIRRQGILPCLHGRCESNLGNASSLHSLTQPLLSFANILTYAIQISTLVIVGFGVLVILHCPGKVIGR